MLKISFQFGGSVYRASTSVSELIIWASSFFSKTKRSRYELWGYLSLCAKH